ncbi:MAG: ThuA domain-containing protein [Ginsengibacter sp.]
MKKILFLSVIAISCHSSPEVTTPDTKPQKVLVYYKTNGFHHDCIPVGIAAIQKLGRENNFAADTTLDSSAFTTKNLEQYATVIFMCTSGNVLNDEQQNVFQQYIRNGGGFVGIHSAAETEKDWPWYNNLLGAYFKNHAGIQEAVLNTSDSVFAATKNLPSTWIRSDEWYNFTATHWDQVHVVLTIDESSYTGGENGNYHPMSWYHEFEGGRSFYTALGHTKVSYSEPLYLQHLLGGIQWAMGK